LNLVRLLLASSLLFASYLPLFAAGSSTVVISQVYGGGGNAGATYRNDFIELLNVSSAPVNLTGWSVQYASSTGTSWQVTNLTGILQPGHYYLVQELAGANGTVDLPTPDAINTTALSATAGKVALVSNAVALSGACPTTSIVDLVGFGSGTNCSESSPTAAPSNTTAVLRKGSGCTDTDSNTADFSVGAPQPRNSASAATACSGSQTLTITTTSLPSATLNVGYMATVAASGGSGTRIWSASNLPPGLSIDPASGIISGTPTTLAGSPYNVSVSVSDSTATANASLPLIVTAAPTCNGAVLIGTIQGSGDASPVVGQQRTAQGIVTGLRSNGFFLQNAAPGDNNPATSDGIFVFTSSAPSGAAVVGNMVCVSGTVSEFQNQTELDTPTVTALASNQPLPVPVTLTASDLDPAGPLDQLEKYSGMRVFIPSLVVTGPTDGSLNESTATSTSNGVYFGVLPGVPRPFREPGIALTDILPAGTPPNVPRFDTNPEIIQVYGPGQPGATPLNVTAGATVSNLTGILSYFPSMYEILPDPASTATATGNITYTPIPDKTASEFTVASTNLERFYNTTQDPIGSGTVTTLTPTAFANRLNKASLGIRNVLKAPDIVAVEELQDLPTLQALAAKINTDQQSATGTNPNYSAYLAEGNDISNINVGFLVKSNVTVVDVTQYGKDVRFDGPNTANAILNDRPPLVLRARVARAGSNDSTAITVIVNHLRSLLDLNDPSSGPQVRAKRQKQAEYLANLIQARQAADPNEKIVVVGDFNAYQFSDGYVDTVGTVIGNPAPADQVVLASPVLVNPGLTVATNSAPAAERYSYTFSGSAQELDQVLLNAPAQALFSRYAVGRLDADFPEIYRNDPNRPERISDHDWPVVYLNLPADAPATATDLTSRVNITSTGLAYSRLSKQYTATLTITNVSGNALNAPLQLVLNNLSPTATLMNASGVAPQGPYITALASGSLAPGASLSVTLRISAPQSASPAYTPLLFGGTF
jgi:predicted extracellular nuclease